MAIPILKMWENKPAVRPSANLSREPIALKMWDEPTDRTQIANDVMAQHGIGINPLEVGKMQLRGTLGSIQEELNQRAALKADEAKIYDPKMIVQDALRSGIRSVQPALGQFLEKSKREIALDRAMAPISADLAIIGGIVLGATSAPVTVPALAATQVARGLIQYGGFRAAEMGLSKLRRFSRTPTGKNLSQVLDARGGVPLAGLGLMTGQQAKIPASVAMDLIQEGSKFYAAVLAGELFAGPLTSVIQKAAKISDREAFLAIKDFIKANEAKILDRVNFKFGGAPGGTSPEAVKPGITAIPEEALDKMAAEAMQKWPRDKAGKMVFDISKAEQKELFKTISENSIKKAWGEEIARAKKMFASQKGFAYIGGGEPIDPKQLLPGQRIRLVSGAMGIVKSVAGDMVDYTIGEGEDAKDMRTGISNVVEIMLSPEDQIRALTPADLNNDTKLEALIRSIGRDEGLMDAFDAKISELRGGEPPPPADMLAEGEQGAPEEKDAFEILYERGFPEDALLNASPETMDTIIKGGYTPKQVKIQPDGSFKMRGKLGKASMPKPIKGLSRGEIQQKTIDALKKNQEGGDKPYYREFELVDIDNVAPYAEFDRGAKPLSKERYQELKDDISKNGMTDAIILSVDGDGNMIVTEGNHRLAVAKELGLKYIPARVVRSTKVVKQAQGLPVKKLPVIPDTAYYDGKKTKGLKATMRPSDLGFLGFNVHSLKVPPGETGYNDKIDKVLLKKAEAVFAENLKAGPSSSVEEGLWREQMKEGPYDHITGKPDAIHEEPNDKGLKIGDKILVKAEGSRTGWVGRVLSIDKATIYNGEGPTWAERTIPGGKLRVWVLGDGAYGGHMDYESVQKISDEEFARMAEEGRKPTQKEEVKKKLKGKVKSIKEVASETGIAEPNIRRILGVGTKEGEFVRVAKGVYTLNINGKQFAYVQMADAVEELPKLAEKGLKVDMVFLDIPYNTPAVKGGNRGVKYNLISPQQFQTVVDSLSKMVATPDTPIFYMYSKADSGIKKMQEYNDIMTKSFKPVATGEYTKVQKDGVSRVTNMTGKIIKPEGIILLSQSGTVKGEVPVDLNFTFVRPKGYQTEKPAEMLNKMIRMGTTREGQIVLDPFAGSGVTAEQAIKLGRSTVAIDISPEAVEAHIKPRVEAAAGETAKQVIQTEEASRAGEELGQSVVSGIMDRIDTAVKEELSNIADEVDRLGLTEAENKQIWSRIESRRKELAGERKPKLKPKTYSSVSSMIEKEFGGLSLGSKDISEELSRKFRRIFHKDGRGLDDIAMTLMEGYASSGGDEYLLRVPDNRNPDDYLAEIIVNNRMNELRVSGPGFEREIEKLASGKEKEDMAAYREQLKEIKAIDERLRSLTGPELEKAIGEIDMALDPENAGGEGISGFDDRLKARLEKKVNIQRNRYAREYLKAEAEKQILELRDEADRISSIHGEALEEEIKALEAKPVVKGAEKAYKAVIDALKERYQKEMGQMIADETELGEQAFTSHMGPNFLNTDIQGAVSFVGNVMVFTGKLKSFDPNNIADIRAVNSQINDLISRGVPDHEFLAELYETYPRLNNVDLAQKQIELRARESADRKRWYRTAKIMAKREGVSVIAYLSRLPIHMRFADIGKACSYLQAKSGMPWYENVYVSCQLANAIKSSENARLASELTSGMKGPLNRESQKTLTEWFQAKYKGEDLPELTAKEQQYVENLQRVFKEMAPWIRKLRWVDWYESRLLGENEGLGETDMKGVEMSKLEEGIPLYETDEAAFDEWIQNQNFGTIGEGYLPRMFLTGRVAKIRNYKMDSTSDKMTKNRLVEDDHSNVDLVLRVDRYINNVLNLKYMREPLKNMSDFIETLSKGDNLWKRGGKAQLDLLLGYAGLLKGYVKTQSALSHYLTPVTRWFNRTIVTKPFLWLLNFFQPWITTPFKMPLLSRPDLMIRAPKGLGLRDIVISPYRDIFNKYPELTDRALKYLDMQVIQEAAVKEAFLAFGVKEKKEFLQKYADFAEWVGQVFTGLDVCARTRVFGPTWIWDKHLLEAYQSGRIPLQKFLDNAGFNLLLEAERQHFLNLLDMDPDEAVMWLAKWNADHQFMYRGTERSLEEMNSEDRWLFNLVTFVKGTMQLMIQNLDKVRKGTPREKRDAAAVIIGTVFMGLLINDINARITGGKRKSKYTGYDIVAMLSWSFGGGIGSMLNDSLRALSDIVFEYTNDYSSPRQKEKVFEAAASSLDRLPRALLPFFEQSMRIVETLTDRDYLSPFKMGVSALMSKKSWRRWQLPVNRTAPERLAHLLFGKVTRSAKREKLMRSLREGVGEEGLLSRAAQAVGTMVGGSAGGSAVPVLKKTWDTPVLKKTW